MALVTTVLHSAKVLRIMKRIYLQKTKRNEKLSKEDQESLTFDLIHAFTQTHSVGEAAIFLQDLLTKAEREMLSLKSSANIPDAPPSETKEEKIEEKIEEKKAEPKEEIKVLSREELEENIKMRDKEKELEEVERLAEEISRKHALGK